MHLGLGFGQELVVAVDHIGVALVELGPGGIIGLGVGFGVHQTLLHQLVQEGDVSLVFVGGVSKIKFLFVMIKGQAVGQSPAAGNTIRNSRNVHGGLALILVGPYIFGTGKGFYLFKRFIKILIGPLVFQCIHIHACRLEHVLADHIGIAAACRLPKSGEHIIFAVGLQLGLQVLIQTPVFNRFHIVGHVLDPIADGNNLPAGHKRRFLIGFGDNVRRVAAVDQKGLLVLVFGPGGNRQLHADVALLGYRAPQPPVLFVRIGLVVAVHHGIGDGLVGLEGFVFAVRIIQLGFIHCGTGPRGCRGTGILGIAACNQPCGH
ncbi:hypothetical protein D3C76_1057050 [compost metagenome]